MGGYTNRVLRVNLTDRTFAEESLSDDLIRDYVGGRGFGVKFLYDDLKPGVDPLGADNELVFIAGPLAGTNAQSFARWKVAFKSPLTGGYYKSSGGGHFASELKFAGFDVVIVTGASETPVYLLIRDGKYELRDASYLWGLNCDDTHLLIREELRDPKLRLACIGPAGENQVKYAGIFSDRRTAGRGGGGTVMGSKNLKAVVVRGHEKVSLADPEGFATAVREQIKAYQAHPLYKTFPLTGTQATQDLSNTLGLYPVNNFREGMLPNREQVDGAEYTKLRVRNTACFACMLHCGSIAKVQTGRYAGHWTEGPEYETIWGFTGPIGCANIGLTVAADSLCDELGLDTISTASALGFAYELYERGLLSKEETGGFELVYGNDEPVLPLIKQIAYREGLGALLAEGTREAARRLGRGSEHYAIQIKGLELPAYDPRGAKAHGLNMVTSACGADHNDGYGKQEIFGRPFKVDRFTVEGKGEITKRNQDLSAVQHAGIMCQFGSNYLGGLELYAKLLACATGVQEFADEAHLWRVGERIVNLERMFNMREGFGRKDDTLPERFIEETIKEGPSAGQVFELDELLADYYQARGWDLQTGIPTAAKLEELGLNFAKR